MTTERLNAGTIAGGVAVGIGLVLAGFMALSLIVFTAVIYWPAALIPLVGAILLAWWISRKPTVTRMLVAVGIVAVAYVLFFSLAVFAGSSSSYEEHLGPIEKKGISWPNDH